MGDHARTKILRAKAKRERKAARGEGFAPFGDDKKDRLRYALNRRGSHAEDHQLDVMIESHGDNPTFPYVREEGSEPAAVDDGEDEYPDEWDEEDEDRMAAMDEAIRRAEEA